MPLTLYAVLAAAVFALGGYGVIKFQHANNARLASERDQALAANAQLEASIADARRQCADALGVLSGKAAADARRAAAAKAAAEKADRTAAAQRDIIERLLTEARTAQPGPQSCARAEEILRQLARDRSAP